METGSFENKNQFKVPSEEVKPQYKLWNPNAASLWSLVFTPAFGAYLHYLNWQELGEEKKAKASLFWFYLTLGIILIPLVEVFFGSTLLGDIAQKSGLIYLIVWYFASAKEQVDLVNKTLKNNYIKQPWLPALGYAIGSLLVIIVAMVIVFSIALG